MSQKDLENTIPYGDLGIIPLESSKAIGKKVDDYIVGWRNETNVSSSIHFTNYKKNSYIIDAVCPRFGSGEAKGILNESVRGKDVYLLVDVCNHSLSYKVCGPYVAGRSFSGLKKNDCCHQRQGKAYYRHYAVSL